MACWNYLPTDILGIIFEYLMKEDGEGSSRQAIRNRKKDIRQCQQTCKSWAGTAQMNLYKNIMLYTLKSSNKFLDTLRKYKLGSLVKIITFFDLGKAGFIQMISSYLLPQIGRWCPDIKMVITRHYHNSNVWRCIQIERSKGFFSKLQVVTPPGRLNEHELIEYYKAAYSLRETLRELKVYHGKSAATIDLENFTNIRTLYFKLDNCGDIYILDQQIKKCSSVEFIDISFNLKEKLLKTKECLLILDTKIHPSVGICTHVKQLFIHNIAFDSRLYGYLMDVFPNLNKLELILYRPNWSTDKISNNIAFRFISYLMKMSSTNVNYFPVENLNDLLMDFEDINGINRHLSISYKKQWTSSHDLEISTTERKIDILVNYSKDYPINLSRIGMIEKSGRKLQSLTLNMDNQFKFGDLKMGVSYSGAEFYNILFYCPKLKNIHLLHTFLLGSDMHFQQKQGLSLRTLILDDCLIDGSFFLSLSYHVNYINTLTIRNPSLPKERGIHADICIDMPETKFDIIDYFQQYYGIHRIFLKLKKIGDNYVGWWFASKNNGFEKCTEEDYEASFNYRNSTSLFICCADIRMITLHTPNFKSIFTNKK